MSDKHKLTLETQVAQSREVKRLKAENSRLRAQLNTQVKRGLLHGLVFQYGTVGDLKARRNRFTRVVQFVLWKAGEQGHKTDFWYPMHPYHHANFKPDP